MRHDCKLGGLILQTHHALICGALSQLPRYAWNAKNIFTWAVHRLPQHLTLDNKVCLQTLRTIGPLMRHFWPSNFLIKAGKKLSLITTTTAPLLLYTVVASLPLSLYSLCAFFLFRNKTRSLKEKVHQFRMHTQPKAPDTLHLSINITIVTDMCIL